jgi:hypothetical protein
VLKISTVAEDVPALDVSTVPEESPVLNEVTAPEDTPTIASKATPDDIEHLLKTIKMEITFSDNSTINKEIVISGTDINKVSFEEPKERPIAESKVTSPSEETKIPWVTVAVLAFVVCASLVTGIFHWYNAYYLPADAVDPGHVIVNPVRTPDANSEQTNDVEASPLPQEPDPDPDSSEEGRRYTIDPLPEFLLLWDEYDNEDIVAILTIGEMEIPVTQSNSNAFYVTHDVHRNPSPLGWVFMDYQVDLYIGMEHNMVIYDPAGDLLRQTIREFEDYDFYLNNPMISLATLFGEFEWEIFSTYVAPSDFPFAIVDHPDDDIWGEVVEQFARLSFYNTMLDVTMYDQVLTIVAPATTPDLYHILQARMLRQITS